MGGVSGGLGRIRILVNQSGSKARAERGGHTSVYKRSRRSAAGLVVRLLRAMIGFCALGFLVFSLKRSRRSFLLLLLLLLNRSLQVSRYGPGGLRFASGDRIPEL